jgi:hypothetical protein
MTASNPPIDQEKNSGTLKARLLRFLASSWVTLALIIAIVAAFSNSVGSARWVPDSTPFTVCVWLGAGFGALLASARFRGWFVALYSLVLSLAASGQAVGGVVLPFGVMGAMSFWDILRVMNVRIFTFFERAGGWASAIASGAKVNDTGLFIFLISLIAWNAGAWLLWSVVRQKRAINGLLPFGFLVGLNVYLSDQDMGYLLLFIACAIMLMSRTAFTRQSADWEARRVDTPYELGSGRRRVGTRCARPTRNSRTAPRKPPSSFSPGLPHPKPTRTSPRRRRRCCRSSAVPCPMGWRSSCT